MVNQAQRLSIVLVEDNPDARNIMATMARELGHLVSDFETAEQALEYLAAPAAPPVHVLVADMRLPGMSGELFAAEVRALRPTLGIVFATGSGAFAGVASDGTSTVLLRKPFGASQFQQALVSVAPSSQVSS